MIIYLVLTYIVFQFISCVFRSITQILEICFCIINHTKLLRRLIRSLKSYHIFVWQRLLNILELSNWALNSKSILSVTEMKNGDLKESRKKTNSRLFVIEFTMVSKRENIASNFDI